MNLICLIKNIFNVKKRINSKKLPSQGFFYKSDFKIWIKKASSEDITEYGRNYVADDFGSILRCIKRIVEKNTFFSEQSSFSDLKSIDIVFVFLEIVKHTKCKEINIEYLEESGKKEYVSFGEKSFNYFKLDEYLCDRWDAEERVFNIDGYKFSLPSIGIESSMTEFLMNRITDKSAEAGDYVKYNYDFTYFLGSKNSLSADEIENLIQIFNYDIEQEELKKIGHIIEMMMPMQKYALFKNNRVIDLSNKINLEVIWK